MGWDAWPNQPVHAENEDLAPPLIPIQPDMALGLNGFAQLLDIHPEGAHDLVLLAVEDVVQAQHEGPVNAPDTPELQNHVLAWMTSLALLTRKPHLLQCQ